MVGQDSNEIHFRVKQTTQMGKLKKSYSERVSAKYHQNIIASHSFTENSLATNDFNLKHGDGLVIVVLAQGGGAGHQPALSL